MTKLPPKEELFQYIAETHQVEKLPCHYPEVTATFNGTANPPNAYADGHLKAISYIITQLIDKVHFPSRPPETITNTFRSNDNLNWVKDLHSLMLKPLLSHPLVSQDPNCPKYEDIGKWRYKDSSNTFSMCPPPSLIPYIMHSWLIKVSTMHYQIKDKLSMTYGITEPQAKQMINIAYDTSLFFSTVQPMPHSNNRFGRLIENALRLQWHFPWKHIKPESQQYKKYTEDITAYQEKLPEIISEAASLAKIMK